MESSYIVFPEPGKVEVRKEEVHPPGPGEVLCKATRSLISTGTETYCLRGDFDPGTFWESWVRYPFRPGYSMVGQVIAVGPDVTGLKVGDRITSRTPHQQIFKLPPAEAQQIPDAVTDAEATWARLAGTTQLGVRRAKLELGESVGVIGLGILGQLVVQYCRLAGARRIVAVDLAANRLEAARAHGATHILVGDANSTRPEIEQITHGKLLDVAFDVTGNPAVLSAAVQLVRRLGRVVLLGDTPNPSQQYLGPGVLSNSIAILGIHGTAHPSESTDFAPWSRVEMTDLFFDYLVQKRMRVDDLITRSVSPLKAPEVYDQMVTDRSGMLGVVFDWTR
jgi:2-desacetyl-2-hydroxyethyl bacteriochlorophyllide A dehydrogenase